MNISLIFFLLALYFNSTNTSGFNLINANLKISLSAVLINFNLNVPLIIYNLNLQLYTHNLSVPERALKVNCIV